MSAPVAATVAQLGARVLRKLGIAIVADAARPGEDAVVGSADIAARVLLQLGMPIAEAARPADAGSVGQAEIAARALRAVGINPAPPGGANPSGIVYGGASLATEVLLKLTVIAPEETPSLVDQAEALARVQDAHDILGALGYVSWSLAAVPASVAEYYIIIAANLAGPQFGKPADPQSVAAAQAGVRMQALSGVYGQALAADKVVEVHEILNAAGLVSWAVSAVPLAQARDYVTLTASLLAPIMGYQQDPPGRAADTAAWDAAFASVRRAGVVAGAGARVQSNVMAVQAELNDLGLVGWTAEAIPASVADAMVSMALMQMGPEFGKAADPKLYAAQVDRVRRVSMGGPAGQALAAAKVLAVQVSLEARGRARWTLYDIPVWAEEPLVLKAAGLLAPEFGMKVDPAWDAMAEMELMRIVSLPSNLDPVRAVYF